MEKQTTEPVVRRRDVRKKEELARRAARKRLGFVSRRSIESHGTSAAAQSCASEQAAPKAAAAVIEQRRSTVVRGSDGSALRRLRRRRLASISAVTTVSAAGVAVAAVLVGGNLGTSDQVQAAESAGSHHTTRSDRSELSPELVDNNARAAKGSTLAGLTNIAGAAPSASGNKAAAAATAIQRTALPGCSGKAPTQQYQNGQMPDDAMCKIGVGEHKLRADAAVAFAKMNAAFKSDTGKTMEITDSYRSLEGQISVAGRKPGLAAKPGTSMHGFGIALDMGGGAASASGTQYDWLVKNASKFGWENPDWAKGGQYEPWHWEYLPARQQIKGH